MIYTNTEQHGDKFLHILDDAFRNASSVSVASGYTSIDIINRYKDDFVRIAQAGGRSRLMVGMAFYEGLSQSKLDTLNTLSNELQAIDEQNGVFVCFVRKYHGKVYKFDVGTSEKIYMGSSNFSRSGLSENIEATLPVTDEDSSRSVSQFLDFLFSEEMAVHIGKADIVVPGSRKYKDRVSLQTLSDLDRYDPASVDTASLEYFEYDLTRVADNEKSNLNVYFGKGRWSRTTGLIKPRPWYEVELIANRELNSLPIYPRGSFKGYTNDGYIIPMKTSSETSNFKNIRSEGNLKLFGMWLKNKLQESGALVPLTPVTIDTLDQYGKTIIRFYKISDGNYFIEF